MFLKPGSLSNELLRDESETSTEYLVYNQYQNLPLAIQRKKLPIYAIRDSLLYCLERYRTLVLVGETGSGKTTQIPQYLYEGGWCHPAICCTQPRRVAAQSVAQRVALERGVPLGDLVGFAVRFEQAMSQKTKICFLTDGMLVREAMIDPLLSRYSVIMLDEVHERSINTDILLGLIRKIMKKRPELRVIIASATLNVQQLLDFFETNNSKDPSQNTAVPISVEGRVYPVDTFYTQVPVRDYVKATIETVLQIHKEEPEGDILVFLTGQEEIETVVAIIKERVYDPACPHHPSVRHLTVLPLYSGLPYELQMRVFDKTASGDRKVIVATNIAETSITLDNIKYVIDSGFVKVRACDSIGNVDTLVVTKEAKTNAQQRKGRAGRTSIGKCFRLFTEQSFEKEMPAVAVPEIQRTNLMSFILQLKVLGIDDIIHFAFLSPPPPQNLAAALEELYALEAIDKNGFLTELGTKIAEFPVSPCLAKMILCSDEYNCGSQILSIAAMLSVQNVFIFTQNKRIVDVRKREFAVYEGDHLTYLNGILNSIN